MATCSGSGSMRDIFASAKAKASSHSFLRDGGGATSSTSAASSVGEMPEDGEQQQLQRSGSAAVPTLAPDVSRLSASARDMFVSMKAKASDRSLFRGNSATSTVASSSSVSDVSEEGLQQRQQESTAVPARTPLDAGRVSESVKGMFDSMKSKANSHSLLRGTSEISEQRRQNSASEPALPSPEITHQFPVVEQPSRCVLSSLGSPHFEQNFLTSTRNGKVTVASSRGDREQFVLVPATNDEAEEAGGGVEERNGEGEGGGFDPTRARAKRKGVFYIRSYKFDRYLTSDSSGSVSTVDLSKENGDDGPVEHGEREKWLLMRSPHGGHFLVSAEQEANVALCRGDESIKIGLGVNNDRLESWRVEFVSGELCFLSSSGKDDKQQRQQVRCDLVGQLTLTDDRRGWEVWRFVEAGAGRVRIVSWMHPFCMVCTKDGKVSTIGVGKAKEEGCDEWTAEKAPEGYCGVVIRSSRRERWILNRGDGGGLATTHEIEGESNVWRLDAAHSQTYTLSPSRRGGTLGPFPYVTDNARQSDQIVLQRIDEGGTVRLYHKSRGQYLRSRVEGEVCCDSSPADGADPSDLWRMEQRPGPEGGYAFSSEAHGGALAFASDEANPRLCTVPPAGAAVNEVGVAWNVDPVLPRAISSSKIKTFAIGTSVAVGTTVAMPFLMAGMLAVIPAEATLAASILGAGLTGAEAIASVGAIGATAAIVFREGGDALGMESEHDGEEAGGESGGGGKDYARRPLCGWRSW